MCVCVCVYVRVYVFILELSQKNCKNVIIIYFVYFCPSVRLQIYKKLQRNEKKNMIMWNSTERNWQTLIVVAWGTLYMRNCRLLWIMFLWTNLLFIYQSDYCLEQSLRQQHRQYSNIYSTRCNVTQFIISGNCSTCFGWYLRPSSEAH